MENPLSQKTTIVFKHRQPTFGNVMRRIDVDTAAIMDKDGNIDNAKLERFCKEYNIKSKDIINIY